MKKQEMSELTKAEDWRQSLPEEWVVPMGGECGNGNKVHLRDHPALAKYASKDEAVKALVHAQQLIGKRPDGMIRLPGEDSAPEEWNELFTILGRPEAPDCYELPEVDMPENFVTDEDFLAQFRAKAFDLGLTARQVLGLYQWFLPMVIDTHMCLNEDSARCKAEELEVLRAMHRSDTPKVMDAARQAAIALGGDDLISALEESGAGNRAAVISAFARMAPQLVEGSFRTSGANSGPVLSKARLIEMMRDPRYKDPSQRDPEYVAQVTKGFETLFPGDYNPGPRV